MASKLDASLAVALGSALGSAARYSVSLAFGDVPGAGFPWGTLLVNVLGSVAIGFLATASGPGGRLLASPSSRAFFLAGVCGGFTTFSVFSLETLLLLTSGRPVLASAYLTASLALWISGALVGHAFARKISRTARSMP